MEDEKLDILVLILCVPILIILLVTGCGIPSDNTFDRAQWDKGIPIKIRWDHWYWGNNYGESFQAAIDEINRRVGCNIVANGEGLDAITILPGAGFCVPTQEMAQLDRDEHETVLARFQDCGDRAEIAIYQPGNVRTAYLIAMHEIGHALGLGHDTNSFSVMHQYIYEWAYLTYEDADALAGRYCPRE